MALTPPVERIRSPEQLLMVDNTTDNHKHTDPTAKHLSNQNVEQMIAFLSTVSTEQWDAMKILADLQENGISDPNSSHNKSISE